MRIDARARLSGAWNTRFPPPLPPPPCSTTAFLVRLSMATVGEERQTKASAFYSRSSHCDSHGRNSILFRGQRISQSANPATISPRPPLPISPIFIGRSKAEAELEQRGVVIYERNQLWETIKCRASPTFVRTIVIPLAAASTSILCDLERPISCASFYERHPDRLQCCLTHIARGHLTCTRARAVSGRVCSDLCTYKVS